MASITKRVGSDGSITYRVRVRPAGKPAKTSTFERLADAKRWAQKLEAELQEVKNFPEEVAEKHTVGELIDRYVAEVLPRKPKAYRNQLRELGWWKEQLGSVGLRELKASQISECRDRLARGKTPRGTLRKPATVNRYLAALSHAFTIAVRDWEWLEQSPIRKISRMKEPRGRVRFLSDDERIRLLAACKESRTASLYTVVVIALATGMRSGEIMNLTWSAVNLEAGTLLLEETKNDERRLVPLAKRALDVLKEWQEQRQKRFALVFPSSKNPKQPVDIKRGFTNAVKRAKIKDFHFHDLRHSTASYLAMSGASLAEIAEVLGHKTLAMVKRYSHFSAEHTKSVVQKMSDKFLEEKE